MLHSKFIYRFSILLLAVSFFISCSEDEEVFEEQQPQSQIDSEVAAKAAENTAKSMNYSTFQDQTNWYEGLDPTTCGVDALLLVYEAFDQQNNSLNVSNIIVWASDSQLSLEETIIQLDNQVDAEFGQDVQLVFVSGVMVNATDPDSVEYAEVNSYTVFSDYFNDCQSDDVEFIIADNNEIPIDPTDPPESEDEVTFPEEPCLTFQFPVDIIVGSPNDLSQTNQITVNDESEFIDYLNGNVSNSVFVDFVYPVTLESLQGNEFVANTSEELEQLFDQECN